MNVFTDVQGADADRAFSTHSRHLRYPSLSPVNLVIESPNSKISHNSELTTGVNIPFTRVFIVIFVSIFLPLNTASAELADYVFTNGKIYTVNQKQPWAEAVAVKANKIVYVGDAAGVDKLKGKNTQVVDLAGKMLLPGFVSGHDHLIASRWMNYGVDLYSAKSKDEYLKLIKEYGNYSPPT